MSNHWSQIDLDRAVPRLAHSATQVGSYVFVIGGHDGSRYSSDVLLLNLGKCRNQASLAIHLTFEHSDHELGDEKDLRRSTQS